MRAIAVCSLLLAVVAASCATPPPPVAESCRGGTLSVYFAHGSATLDPLAEEMLDIAAAQVAGCLGARLEVAGYADPTGDAAANLVLSERRAQAVLEGVLSRGVMAESVAVIAMGDEGAITEDGLTEPMRRRVEIRFVPPGG